MTPDDERPLLTNRDRKRAPRLRGGWCFGCDAALVHPGQKCPVCRQVFGKVRRNKRGEQ